MSWITRFAVVYVLSCNKKGEESEKEFYHLEAHIYKYIRIYIVVILFVDASQQVSVLRDVASK